VEEREASVGRPQGTNKFVVYEGEKSFQGPRVGEERPIRGKKNILITVNRAKKEKEEKQYKIGGVEKETGARVSKHIRRHAKTKHGIT